jgi:hypothetical protein
VDRKLTAILCADAYGYSRLMEKDGEATLRTLSTYRKIIDSLIEEHYAMTTASRPPWRVIAPGRAADSVMYYGRERSLGIPATEFLSTVPACTRLSSL